MSPELKLSKDHKNINSEEIHTENQAGIESKIFILYISHL